MPIISHQTITLGRGKHTSPEHGACVMELASMLAGEPFTDHPRAVSPAIASFLRSLNDLLDDDHRQDLYAYAAACVGTAGPVEIEQARAERLLEFGDECWEARAHRSITERLRRHAARERRRSTPEAAARYAMHALGRLSGERQAAALRLVDELIALGSPAPASAERAPAFVTADAEETGALLSSY